MHCFAVSKWVLQMLELQCNHSRTSQMWLCPQQIHSLSITQQLVIYQSCDLNAEAAVCDCVVTVLFVEWRLIVLISAGVLDIVSIRSWSLWFTRDSFRINWSAGSLPSLPAIFLWTLPSFKLNIYRERAFLGDIFRRDH